MQRQARSVFRYCGRTTAALMLSLAAGAAAAAPSYYTMTDLGTLGGDRSGAYGINGNRQIVGESQPGGDSLHAFLWDSGSMTDLGELQAGAGSRANAVNDLGQAVGFSSSTRGDNAFIWDIVFGMLDLNDLVIDLGGFELVEAYDISDTGYIVARALSATEDRVVLLSPIGCV